MCLFPTPRNRRVRVAVRHFLGVAGTSNRPTRCCITMPRCRWLWLFGGALGVGLSACGADDDAPLLGRKPVVPVGIHSVKSGTLPHADPRAKKGPADPHAAVGQPEPAPPSRDWLPQYEEAALRDRGIRKVSGTHLTLYTDLPTEIVRTAPPLLDGLFPALVKRFGRPTPAQARGTWKVVGHVMADRERFRSIGLLPEDLPDFPAGISREIGRASCRERV